MTGPSASGSENGTPSSSTSTPARSSSSAASTVRSREGSPAVRKATKAAFPSARRSSNLAPIRPMRSSAGSLLRQSLGRVLADDRLDLDLDEHVGVHELPHLDHR